MSDSLPTPAPSNPKIDDPYYQLVYETTNAILSMSRAVEDQSKVIAGHDSTFSDIKVLLARFAKAEEEANAARQGRWSDMKGALVVLYSNTILSGALTLALSMLAIGLALWVLAQLGVDVAQVVPWLKGGSSVDL